MRTSKSPVEPRLTRTILITVLSFFLFQALYFGSVSLIFKIKLSRFIQFLIISTLYHNSLLLGLIILKKEFYLETSRKPLTSINLPIFLSFTRLSSVPTVLFLLLSIDKIPLLPVTVPFVCFIFLTDLFDGLLARKMHQTTRIGRIIDSSSDYLNIFVITILFLIYRLIPVWLFIILSLRFFIHCVGIIILYFNLGYTVLKVSFLAKTSVFATMVLCAFELMEYLQVRCLGNEVLVTSLEYLTAVIVILSLGEKLLFLNRTFLSLKKIRGKRRESRSSKGLYN